MTKLAFHRWLKGIGYALGLGLILSLTLGLPLAGAQTLKDPDLNDDGIVNTLDVSIVGKCFNKDLSQVTACQCADIDRNNLVNTIDYRAVTAALGRTGYPVGPNPCVPSSSNRPPVANAGPDQTVSVLSTVILNGSGSSDPDGNSLAFTWSFVSTPPGSGATLSNPTAVMPTFTADQPGSYVVQLWLDPVKEIE